MLIAACACAVAAAAATAPPDGPPPARSVGEQKPPLAGPAVREAGEAAGAPTLVVRAFDGTVRRTERAPELAAAALVGLDEQTRAAVGAIEAERNLLLDEFVSTNLGLLGRLEAAGAAGRGLDLLIVGHEAWVKLGPLREKGILRDRVRAALPEDRRAAYDRILREYWAALVAEGKRQRRPDGRARAAWEILVQERLESFGREVERALARVLRSGELVYRLLLDGIELRPAQAEKIRGLIADFMERHGEGAAGKDWALLGLSIAAHLDPEQLVRFAENVRRLPK